MSAVHVICGRRDRRQTRQKDRRYGLESGSIFLGVFCSLVKSSLGAGSPSALAFIRGRWMDNAKIRGGGTEWIDLQSSTYIIRGWQKAKVPPNNILFWNDKLRFLKMDRIRVVQGRKDMHAVLLTSISLARKIGARLLRRRLPSLRTSFGRGCGWRSSTATK